MNIKLNKIALVNFKGVKSKEITFNAEGETFIFGANASGKTTIFDAFTWLLFGKDSSDRSDFDIKTLDDNGNVIHKLDHEVWAKLLIDDKEVILKRTIREKWVTKRGSSEPVMQGHETSFTINEVPKSVSEFKAYIDNLINEGLFKLITNPTAFNSLHWKERRKILTDITGDVNSDEVIRHLEVNSDDKQLLLNILAKDMTIEDYRKVLISKIKKSKDALKDLPARIDEANRSMPQEPDGGFDEINRHIKALIQELAQIDKKIIDKSKLVDDVVNKLSLKKSTSYEIQSKIDALRNEIEREIKSKRSQSQLQLKQSQLNALQSQISVINGQIKSKQSQIENCDKEIQDINTKLDNLRDEWRDVNSMEFKDEKCASCGQELPQDKIELLKNKFNINKSNVLKSINDRGVNLKSKITELETSKQTEAKEVEKLNIKLTAIEMKFKNLVDEIAELNVEPTSIDDEVNNAISNSVEIKGFNDELTKIKSEIKKLEAQMITPDIEPLNENKTKLIDEIDKLKHQLTRKELIVAQRNRIEKLMKDEKDIAKLISGYDKEVNLIDLYINATVEVTETKVNALFNGVNFKMFEHQINGGITQTCVCTVDGVPYPSVNTAGKICAGLEIIKVISNHYGASAPIFIDNRESVIDIPTVNAQIINLVVSEADENLRVV